MDLRVSPGGVIADLFPGASFVADWIMRLLYPCRVASAWADVIHPGHLMGDLMVSYVLSECVRVRAQLRLC